MRGSDFNVGNYTSYLFGVNNVLSYAGVGKLN